MLLSIFMHGGKINQLCTNLKFQQVNLVLLAPRSECTGTIPQLNVSIQREKSLEQSLNILSMISTRISTDQLSALISPLLDSCPWFRFELLKFSQFFLLYTDCCAVSDWTRRISKVDWLRCAVVKKTSTVTWLCSRYYAKNPVTGFSSCAPCMRLRVLVQCHLWESLRVQRQKGGTGFLS